MSSLLRRRAPSIPPSVSKPTIVPAAAQSLQIDPELQAWATQYAKRHYTTLPQILTDHLVRLKKIEDGDGLEQV